MISHRSYRRTLRWMGERITTLADARPARGGALVVGFNPRQESVEKGHYFQGNAGQRVWDRLRWTGLLRDIPGFYEDEALAADGHGLTDLVKRPGKRPNAIPQAEKQYGVGVLRRNIRDWKPSVVIFAFAEVTKPVFGKRVSAGVGPSLEGRPTVVLPGPRMRKEEALGLSKSLRRRIRRWTTGARASPTIAADQT